MKHNYYVFRINYSEWFEKIREELIVNHRLRQGWGGSGMRIDQGVEVFADAWKKTWGTDTSEADMRRRYSNLCIMTEIRPGDYIIVPKISLKEEWSRRSFVVARCSTAYHFEVFRETNDFGHYIGVDQIFSCAYDFDADSETISSKFRAYQSPITKVRNEFFTNAIDALVQKYTESPGSLETENPFMTAKIHAATRDVRTVYLKEIVEALQRIGNDKFEHIIRELFEKNGYRFVGNNMYDRRGGDADLIFEGFAGRTLMHSIYEVSDMDIPRIYVQAKKKTGIDKGDITGVEQLLRIRESRIPKEEINSTMIVINLADTFGAETKAKAKEAGIILINGSTFASLLVRYGIEADIF